MSKNLIWALFVILAIGQAIQLSVTISNSRHNNIVTMAASY